MFFLLFSWNKEGWRKEREREIEDKKERLNSGLSSLRRLGNIEYRSQVEDVAAFKVKDTSAILIGGKEKGMIIEILVE